MQHKVTNNGRYAIEVRLVPGTVITKVKPGESYVGEIESIIHGDAPAHYTVETIEDC